MPTIVDLTAHNWTLHGWRPYDWMNEGPRAMASDTFSDVPPMPARLPGSVQRALLENGWIRDWNVGMQSLECEWVEHRHWEFQTSIQVAAGEAVTLFADGLDHHGWVLIDHQVVSEFSGSLTRHRFDLSDALVDGQPHRLRIIFDTPPEEQGQMGFTSRSKHFKPRFNYGWDWCPRFVPIGVSDRLWLQVGCATHEVQRLRTELLSDLTTGRIELDLLCHEPTNVQFESRQEELAPGLHSLIWEQPVDAWEVNGKGDPKLYDLHIGDETVAVGFKHVRWLPCEGAPEGAEPWICEINGVPTFLQGVNWTPLSVDYVSVSDADYGPMVERYRAMGCNLLRVWGGAALEREAFYQACDRAGILVWQEFPLSSSGHENNAPSDTEAIDRMSAIARDYVRRRRHHACRLLWCGGNELQTAMDGSEGIGKPLDVSHPCLASLARVVAEEDPGVRFIPTSASGPTFMADAANFGKGLHHDVHGPWTCDPGWEEYWANDDALFRSEVGTPAATSADIVERFRGKCSVQPVGPQNPYWQHYAAWWTQEEMAQGVSFADYVVLSQDLQARVLATAAQACKSRFPRCGGFLVWMGHDCVPTPINTAIIDFEGNPKPAYHALAKVFRNKALDQH